MSSPSYLSSPLSSWTRSPSRPSSRNSNTGRASPIISLQDEQGVFVIVLRAQGPRGARLQCLSNPRRCSSCLHGDCFAITNVSHIHADSLFVVAVAIRTQMSTLKHTIRYQQAQLQSLESTIRSGPRPFPPGTFSPSEFDTYSMAQSPPPAYASSSSNGSTRASSPFRTAKRRSSFEVLSTLAGRDSSLPLPKTIGRSPSFGDEIREGIPVSSPTKRQSSPTRTLSRMSSLPFLSTAPHL